MANRYDHKSWQTSYLPFRIVGKIMQRVSYITFCICVYTAPTNAMWQRVMQQFPDVYKSHKKHAETREREIDTLCNRMQRMIIESSSQKRLSTQTS